jgi:hypothetical protein
MKLRGKVPKIKPKTKKPKVNVEPDMDFLNNFNIKKQSLKERPTKATLETVEGNMPIRIIRANKLIPTLQVGRVYYVDPNHRLIQMMLRKGQAMCYNIRR